MERLCDSLMRLDMSDQLDQFNTTSYNRTGDEFFMLLYQLIDVIKSSYSYPHKVLKYLLKYIPNYKILVIMHYLNINIGYPVQYEFSRKGFLNELIKVFPNTPPPILSKFQHLALQLISNYQILTNPSLNSFYANEMQQLKQLYLLLNKKGYILPRPTLNEQDRDILIHSITDIDKKHVLLEELIRGGEGMQLVKANDLMKELVNSDAMSDTIRVKVTQRERMRTTSSEHSPKLTIPFSTSHLAIEHQETVNLIVNHLLSHPRENQQMIYELMDTLPNYETKLLDYLKELVIQHISGTYDRKLENMIHKTPQEPIKEEKVDLLLDLSTETPQVNSNNGLIDFLSDPISPKQPTNATQPTMSQTFNLFDTLNLTQTKPSQPVQPIPKVQDPFDFITLGAAKEVPMNQMQTSIYKSPKLSMTQKSITPVVLSATLSGIKQGNLEGNWQFAVPVQYKLTIHPIGEMKWNTSFDIKLDIQGSGTPVPLKFKIDGDVQEQGQCVINK